jgi:peroxisomal 2,4-dienoyl-CoA reductase
MQFVLEFLQYTSATENMTSNTFNKDLLSGKVAFVTGGGSGIAKGIAEAFMHHGANVVIVGRTKEKLENAAEDLRNKTNNGTKCLTLPCDVRDYKKLSAVFDEAISQLGRIDILVNGAAGNFLSPASKLSSNAFKTVLDIDTFGTFNASKLAHEKYMKKHGGSIINLSMNFHHYAQIMQVHAGTAKAGIDAMTKHLAVEWGLDNVRVNGIAIGSIEDTEGMSKLLPSDLREQMKKAIPLQRFGTIKDIAEMGLFLASPSASYITGAILQVDGGSVFTSGGFMYPEALIQMSKL